MRLLTVVDQLFVQLESRTQPMHVGALFLFEPPEDAGDCFVTELMQQMQTSTTPPSFPFNQVLHNLLFWQTDDNFEIYQHFRHIALPKPATINELLDYVSLEHGRLLNKSNPMWECHVIEGINDDSNNQKDNPKQFALYFKIHHSLVDGIAAMRLVQKSLSQSSTEVMTLPLWSLLTRHRHQLDNMLPIQKPTKKMIKEQLATIKPVFKELSKSFTQLSNPNFITTLKAPMSMLNQRITASRRVAIKSYDLTRFNHLSKQLNVTVNDIVLAVCSGALRNYLIKHDELPNKPLIAFVPISLRKDSSSSGNQLSFILSNLGTHLRNPLDRLETIHGSMNDGKKRFGRMTQHEVINYSLIAYSWGMINIMTSLFPKKQAFNLIISNVPGSKKPLFWNGAKLKALYPASILMNGQAMNITFATYLDRIEFGITACDDVLPNIQSVLSFIEDEISELEKLIK